MRRILLVGTDPETESTVRALANDEGLELSHVETLREARDSIPGTPPGLVLAEERLADGRGNEILDDAEQCEADVALILEREDSDAALEALREGVVEYLTRPIDPRRLRSLVRSYSKAAELRDEVTHLREELRGAGRLGPLLGMSPAMETVFGLIEQVAPTEAAVFVTGESGTGKELVAQTIHRLSRRRRRELLAVNCGAISPNLIESELFGHEKGSFTGAERRHEGFFERAHHGTLFLDEITEMPTELQVRLLRVLETGEVQRVGGTETHRVDVRIVAASNREPAEAVDEGLLREDLYYRLRVFPIPLPPLREREDDVELLARYFLALCNRREGTRKRITDETIDHLLGYAWPGNVRELQNVVERAFILAGERITSSCLAPEVKANLPSPSSGNQIQARVGDSLEEVERRLILATLAANDGKRAETAEVLGISPKTLYNRLKAYEADEG